MFGDSWVGTDCEYDRGSRVFTSTDSKGEQQRVADCWAVDGPNRLQFDVASTHGTPVTLAAADESEKQRWLAALLMKKTGTDDYVMKIMLIGGGCGKSSLLRRFVHDTFDINDAFFTIGINDESKTGTCTLTIHTHCTPTVHPLCTHYTHSLHTHFTHYTLTILTTQCACLGRASNYRYG
jgi:hypothetical protein